MLVYPFTNEISDFYTLMRRINLQLPMVVRLQIDRCPNEGRVGSICAAFFFYPG